MKVLGVSGSPRRGKTTDRLVREVLSAVDCETEFVSLAGKRISPCIACLGCVPDNVCKVKDDMRPLRDKIVEADGLVIGAPNYFSLLNGMTHNFLERFCQFRHRSGRVLAGKPAVIISIGGVQPEIPARHIERIFGYYQIHSVGALVAQGPASCFSCGHGETCEVGAVHMLYGPGTRIEDSIIPGLDKQPEKIDEARVLGRKLKMRLDQKKSGK